MLQKNNNKITDKKINNRSCLIAQLSGLVLN